MPAATKSISSGQTYPLIHYPKEEKVFRFASIPTPTMPDFSIPIPLSAQLGTTIRRIDLEIIHAHSPFLLGRLGAYAARQYGLPLIFTFTPFTNSMSTTCP